MNKYEEKWLGKVKACNTDKEIVACINQLYTDGMIDGAEEAEAGAEHPFNDMKELMQESR